MEFWTHLSKAFYLIAAWWMSNQNLVLCCGSGKNKTFHLQVCINLTHSSKFWVRRKSLSPWLNHGQNLLLDGLWTLQCHQFCDKLLLADKNVKGFAAVFDSCLKNCQGIECSLTALTHWLLQSAHQKESDVFSLSTVILLSSYSSHCLLRTLLSVVDDVTNLHD